ncbi:hypothetical protein KTE19_01590 [Lentilactobacillus sp. IMAU92037]|uniref:DUF5776 domain-containing protein n=1 Tax=Lentilactobacillus dabitei TaxID=2831523 RepID=UPI00156BBC63|nr:MULTISPECIES: DUF5776 domain-containing protein [Lentilactobacillus]MBV0929420.1 hypothetical protein [Lentilactobacillus dabitei]
MYSLVKKLTKVIIGTVGLGVIGLSGVVSQPAYATDGGASSDNSVITVATKDQLPGTKSPDFLYGRGMVTEHQSDPAYNGRLYATSEHYVTGTPSFVISESTDHGGTWKVVGEVKDLNKGVGNRYQPFLYELPEKVGNMDEGTLICAGNAIPGDLSSSSIVLYKSTDHGRSWSYLSTVANGGKAVMGSTPGPIWEPFVKVIDHKLVCYYSDERDQTHYAQKLVHQVSNDGVNWGSVVDDVDFNNSAARPGMVTVAQMPNGKYIMTYEVVNSGEWRTNFKISDDGLNWDSSSEGTRLAYGGSPYITVLPDGTLVANTAGQGDLFVNKNNGTGTWEDVKMPMDDAYSRSLTALPNNQVLLVSGGRLKAPDSTEDNILTSMVYDLPAQYHRATVQFANQPTSLAAGKTANFTVKLSDSSAADFDITTDDAQDVTVEKQADGSYQLKVNSNFVGQKDVTVTATKKDDASFSANFKVSITGQAAPTPDNNNSTNTGTTGTITTPSSSSQATTIKPSTTQPTTTSQPAATKKFKQFKVYAKTGIRVYKGVDFKHVVKSYAKHSRTNAKTFIVTGKAYSKNGALRYKTAAGYITANSKYVANLYYQTAPKKVTVLAKAGTYEYTKPTFSKANRSTHLKKGTIVKVKKLVKQGSLSKFVLTNGHYLTANKKLIIAQP